MTQDLNTCQPDDIVNVSDIPEYQGVTVVRISDSGVTISSGKQKDVVLSGRSPATLVSRGRTPFVMKSLGTDGTVELIAAPNA